MLCLFCHECTLVDHLDNLEVIRRQFGPKLYSKFCQIMILKQFFKIRVLRFN